MPPDTAKELPCEMLGSAHRSTFPPRGGNMPPDTRPIACAGSSFVRRSSARRDRRLFQIFEQRFMRPPENVRRRLCQFNPVRSPHRFFGPQMASVRRGCDDPGVIGEGLLRNLGISPHAMRDVGSNSCTDAKTSWPARLVSNCVPSCRNRSPPSRATCSTPG